MEFPIPDLGEYAKFTATALLLLAVFQYTGVFYEDAGTVDWRFLLAVGLTLPLFTYVLTTITVNVERLPDHDRMIRTRK